MAYWESASFNTNFFYFLKINVKPIEDIGFALHIHMTTHRGKFGMGLIESSKKFLARPTHHLALVSALD